MVQFLLLDFCQNFTAPLECAVATQSSLESSATRFDVVGTRLLRVSSARKTIEPPEDKTTAKSSSGSTVNEIAGPSISNSSLRRWPCVFILEPGTP